MASKAMKRILQEAKEMQNNQDMNLMAGPLEDDLFNWHFSVRGAIGTDYENGIYHGRMLLPANYPFSPPEIYLLTPSGRFETNKKICLSISSFHPESWQPSWGIRTALIALTAFFESEAKGAVGSLDCPPEERRRLAKLSKDYKCSTCGFDCHSKFCQPSPPVVVEPVTIAGTVETSVNHQAEAETASPSTTIFPTARVGALPSPADIGIPPVGPEMNGPVRAGEIENPVAPVLVRMGPVNVMTVAGTGGGSPLMVDRLIMVVLMMVLALVAKKLS